MSKYTKPDVSKVWAEAGSKTKPLDSKINTGWVVEKPKFENMNWLQNRQDSYLRYVNQLGIPEWDDKTEYIATQSYVQGTTTGSVYRCVTTHGGLGGSPQNPEADTTDTYWALAFDVAGSAAAVQTQVTALQTAYPDLTGVNAGTARTNLSVYSKSYIDALFAAIPSRTGEIALCGGNTPKVGTLQLKGQLVSRTTYAGLWAYAQTSGNITANDAAWSATTTPGSFSPGDGSTTFRLPDYRGLGVRGWADDGATDAGRAIGSFQDGKGDSLTVETRVSSLGGAIPPQTITIPTNGTYTGWFNSGDANSAADVDMRWKANGSDTTMKNLAAMYVIYT